MTLARLRRSAIDVIRASIAVSGVLAVIGIGALAAFGRRPADGVSGRREHHRSGTVVAPAGANRVTASDIVAEDDRVTAEGFDGDTPCGAVSTITFRAASSATGTSGDLVLSKPTGLSANDVMVAHFATRASDTTITAPTGWNLIRDLSVAGAGLQAADYWKVATASEPSSYTWSSSGGQRTAGGILAYSGVSTTNPVNVEAGTTGVSTSIDAPSVTTTFANTQLLAFWTARQQTIDSTDAAMTQRWNVSTGGGAGSIGDAGADEARAAVGATGIRSATTAQSFDWIALSVALQPNIRRVIVISGGPGCAGARG